MATADEWRNTVARWRASGLTAREFGALHGISKKQLQNWAYRLGQRAKRKEGSTTPAVRLLRVVRSAKTSKPVRTEVRSGIRLSLAGAAVDVEPGFDEATLRRLIVVIKEVQEGAR